MSTHSGTWKRAEAKVAAMFGSLRQILSGSSGRAENTASDSTHPRLFIECKYRDRHAVRGLWERTRDLAKKERKTPVVSLVDKGMPGFLLCIHSDDFRAVVVEWARSLDPEKLDEFDRAVRVGRLTDRGEIEEEDEAA
jgi:hypothetical protein